MQAYSVAVQCNHRPLYDPISAQIVCVKVASSAYSVLASTGALIWQDTTRQLMTQPVLMIELGVSYAFIMDVDATLYGYQIPLVAPTLAPQTLPPGPPTPAPTPSPQGNAPPEDEGMSAGSAAGVAIGVIIAAAAIGFFAYQYSRRARRQSYQATNLNQEYGSVS
ncbi:transmembrane protein, putative [Bodo saltans]|uniref:Transmembrane protein, putative n=1 Tax=Bodo saltans TaxID=75058 RepID=A0A0S4KIA5_BODSA|nr:transmembrane protein, putative [Bodo saltans]|eukprot:CUI14249.1 transmembrane protein, putative [Bodo saltans]